MTLDQRVKLLDAAMRSANGDAYLTGMQDAFDRAGRHDDALTAGVLRTLLSLGEIELLMLVRAAWLAASERSSRPTAETFSRSLRRSRTTRA